MTNPDDFDDSEVNEEDLQDIMFLHPMYLTPRDWAHIRKLAGGFELAGHDKIEAAVYAYFEWIGDFAQGMDNQH